MFGEGELNLEFNHHRKRDLSRFLQTQVAINVKAQMRFLKKDASPNVTRQIQLQRYIFMSVLTQRKDYVINRQSHIVLSLRSFSINACH